MDISRAIQILEALASGCSPLTGELLDKESILNHRDVIRALQIAIDRLANQNQVMTGNVQIDEADIKNVIDLFKAQQKNPTPHSLTGFFLGTRLFKNHNLVSNKLYGKFRGEYTSDQLMYFFSQYLIGNNVITKNSLRIDSYKQIDFFQKEIFNKLTPSAINQLKGKVNELGVVKTDNLSGYIQEARKTHIRAYEHWSDKEMELLSKAIRYTNDLDFLSECFQRGKGSIESVVLKLIFESENTTDKP